MDIRTLSYALSNDIGLLAFAVAGSYKAIDRKLDILGVAVLGFATALGGGITRDILANRSPAAFSGYNDISFAFAGIVAAILLYKVTKKDMSQTILIKMSDAVGLAAFTVTGAVVAYNADFNIAGIILLATSTAVGGGLISDVLTNKIPMVLAKDFYATCTIIGAVWFYILTVLGVNEDVNMYTTFFVVFALRAAAIVFNWHLPKV